MNIIVFGAGTFGTAIAKVLSSNNKKIIFYYFLKTNLK